MDSLDIPLPPTSSIPLPADSAPKLVISSLTDGERSVSTVMKDNEENGTKSLKKKHKKEKHKHKHKHKEKDKDKSKDKKKKQQPLITPEVLSQHASAIKAAMLKEVQGESKDAELSQSIVDDLFKDFLAAKMNEIESAYKKAAEEKTAGGDVATSVEEMNKLLDDELDTISQNTTSPAKKASKSEKSSKSHSDKSIGKNSGSSKRENSSGKSHYRSSKRESGLVQPLEPLSLSHIEDIKVPKIPDFSKSSKSRSNTLISSVVKQVQSQDSSEHLGGQPQVYKTLQMDKIDDVKVVPSSILTEKDKMEGPLLPPKVPRIEGNNIALEIPPLPPLDTKLEGPEPEPKVALESKKPGKLQLAFKISQTSAELISKGAEDPSKKDLKLEEGEVLSSGHGSSSDSDTDNEGDGEISETGSLSDSDKDQKDKSKKKKKKKKHKKKKKKHKVERDKDDTIENRNKRKHSSHRSSSRSKSPKKHRGSRSRSKERRKRSKSKSFSPGHGVWRERSRSKEKGSSKSFSPEHGIWRSSRYKHDRDKSREKDRDRDRRYDREKDLDHNRDHERHKKQDHDRDYDRGRRKSSRDRDYDKRDSERRYGKWRSRSRSRSKERRREKEKSKEDLRLKIDKAKLREIAMKNALAMAKSGHDAVAGVDLTAIKAGGKSIGELTEFCARIASKEKLKKDRPEGLTSSSSSDDDKSDDDSLIHHPFKVVDKNITMNIRNATSVPIMSAQEKITQQATLRLTFPVSSGNVHRTKEIEWVPVEKTETVKTQVVSATTTTVSVPTTTGTAIESTAVIPTVATEVKLMPVREEDKVFTDPAPAQEPPPVDISAIIGERIKAARKLAENPRDSAAMSAMQKAQHNASLWATSKNLPGKFMGSTGAQILSQDELIGPDKKRQAWAKKAISEVKRYRKYRKKFSTDVVRKLVLKSLGIIGSKDQFNRAAPVKSGIGMALLQKMGWQQGTGLGKNNEGGLEPLALDFKMDRKGLSSQDEYRPSKRVNVGNAPVRKDLSGKHPVSALVELCNKRRWGSPDFQLLQEGGPDHKKTFLFKVIVNGVEYRPSSASQNKKLAKAAAATAVLQEMGLVPRD